MIHTYVTFDPRTKMLLLMTMAIFVLGGAGDKLFGAYLPLFCLLPFVLFILVGKWKRAAGYIILYSVFYLHRRQLQQTTTSGRQAIGISWLQSH